MENWKILFWKIFIVLYLYWLYSQGKDVMFIFIDVLFVVISFSVLSLNFSRILKIVGKKKKCKINNSNVK